MTIDALGGVRNVAGDYLAPPDSRGYVPGESPSFSSFLKDAIKDTNELEERADAAVAAFAGGAQIDVHEVMIALSQADTAVALTTQVRNKLVDAYQDLMRMSV